MGNFFDACCSQSAGVTDDAGAETNGGTNRVELAISKLFTIPGLASAYHTSVLVNGEEFFFSDSGIFSNRVLTSHQGEASEVVLMGLSKRTGSQVLEALKPHFRPGTYDLLRKNCNSFSDCALHFLLGKRLPGQYSAMEALGQKASLELLQRFTKGAYQPNEAAASFDTDAVISELEKWQANSNSSTDSSASRSKPALFIGAQVTIVGLKNNEQLNGQGARIQRFNAVNGRWEARINFSGESKALRAENLRPAGELVLIPGDKCRIHALESESGKALNGQEGVVQRYLHDVSRYEVSVSSMLKALRAENLQLLQ